MSTRKILVVEDNPEERKIYSTYLGFVGGTMLKARNGEEGVRAAREQHPDLIILDLTMPVQDGWETIRILREDPETRRIPVIAVTSHHLERKRLTDAGFNGYLEKPVAPFRILEEVERCLGPLDEGEPSASSFSRSGSLPSSLSPPAN